MKPEHQYYLNLGSNILPEVHLREAVRLLRAHGRVGEISSVWESHAVGSDGPNFLNVSLGFGTSVDAQELKDRVVADVEGRLGRVRTSDKNAPRTIDIDILMQDGTALNEDRWAHAFVVLPMAELLPDARHPGTGNRLADEAVRAYSTLWIRRRPDVVIPPRV